jgi:hypothetical protein
MTRRIDWLDLSGGAGAGGIASYNRPSISEAEAEMKPPPSRLTAINKPTLNLRIPMAHAGLLSVYNILVDTHRLSQNIASQRYTNTSYTETSNTVFGDY